MTLCVICLVTCAGRMKKFVSSSQLSVNHTYDRLNSHIHSILYNDSTMSAVSKLVRQVRNYSSSTKAPSHFVNSFRQAMTSLASPAVILTTANKDLKTGVLHPRGLTASSFNSLSIKPWPLITFNIQVPSHAADAMRNPNPDLTTPNFAINILPATQSAAKLVVRLRECWDRTSTLYTSRYYTTFVIRRVKQPKP